MRKFTKYPKIVASFNGSRTADRFTEEDIGNTYTLKSDWCASLDIRQNLDELVEYYGDKYIKDFNGVPSFVLPAGTQITITGVDSDGFEYTFDGLEGYTSYEDCGNDLDIYVD